MDRWSGCIPAPILPDQGHRRAGRLFSSAIVGPELGSKTETLHEKCAAQWFAALRNFDTDDDDRADRMSAMQGETKR
jgi:hypothetical protein